MRKRAWKVTTALEYQVGQRYTATDRIVSFAEQEQQKPQSMSTTRTNVKFWRSANEMTVIDVSVNNQKPQEEGCAC